MFPRPKINWLALFTFAMFISNLAGLFLIYRRLQPPSPAPTANMSPSSPNSGTDSERLTQIEQQADSIQAENQTLRRQILGSAVSPPPAGLAAVLPDLDTTAAQSITISDSRFSQIDVYEIPLASSKVVSHLEFGKVYPFTSRQKDWYQVQLPDGIFGWVSAQLVKPI